MRPFWSAVSKAFTVASACALPYRRSQTRCAAAFVLLAVVVTGCGGPPALTSGTIQGEQRYFFLDNAIGTQEPRDVPGIIESLESRPHVSGIDTVEKIETKFTSAGGTCSRKAGQIECYIERARVSRDCFQGRCEIAKKEWTVLIRAPDRQGLIKPKVRIELRRI